MDVLIIQPDRSSTETSIFSIYSMYMEDTPRNSLRIPSVSLTLPDDHKDDFFVTSDLAYYDSSPPRPPSSSAPSSSPRTPSLHPHPPASPPPQNTAYRPIARRKILSAHHGVHSTSRWSIWLAGVVPLCRFVTCPHCPPQEHQPLLPCTQTPAVRCSMRSLLLLTHLFN